MHRMCQLRSTLRYNYYKAHSTHSSSLRDPREHASNLRTVSGVSAVGDFDSAKARLRPRAPLNIVSCRGKLRVLFTCQAVPEPLRAQWISAVYAEGQSGCTF